jgi:hypothetical protein
MALWQVRHFSHSGDLLHTINPENLRFSLNHNDPHDIAYEVSMDNPVIDEENTGEGDFIGAWQQDWRLLRDGTPIQGMSGPITSVHMAEGEEAVQITGKSWLEYLDRRHFPWDTDLSDITEIPMFRAFDKDVTDIIKDIIQATMARPNSLAIDTTDLDSRTTFRENLRIEFVDTESILSKIKQLAEGEPGFDFEMTWGKHFKLYYPEFSDPTNIEFISITAEPPTLTTTNAAYDVDWTDNGPQGTHLLALGSGLAYRMAIALGSDDGQETFRRLDFTMDFGDVPKKAKLSRLAKGALRAGVRPQREVPIKIIPEQIHDFWTRVRPGSYFVNRTDLIAHQVTGTKKIIGIECEVTNEGEELVELHSELWRAWYNVEDTHEQM